MKDPEKSYRIEVIVCVGHGRVHAHNYGPFKGQDAAEAKTAEFTKLIMDAATLNAKAEKRNSPGWDCEMETPLKGSITKTFGKPGMIKFEAFVLQVFPTRTDLRPSFNSVEETAADLQLFDRARGPKKTA